LKHSTTSTIVFYLQLKLYWCWDG